MFRILIAHRKVCNSVLSEFGLNIKVWRAADEGWRWGRRLCGRESSARTQPSLRLPPVPRAQLVQRGLACVSAFKWFLIFRFPQKGMCPGTAVMFPPSDVRYFRAGLCLPLRLRAVHESLPLRCGFPKQRGP